MKRSQQLLHGPQNFKMLLDAQDAVLTFFMGILCLYLHKAHESLNALASHFISLSTEHPSQHSTSVVVVLQGLKDPLGC